VVPSFGDHLQFLFREKAAGRKAEVFLKRPDRGEVKVFSLVGIWWEGRSCALLEDHAEPDFIFPWNFSAAGNRVPKRLVLSRSQKGFSKSANLP
jgi:hypothetical protein